MGRAPRRIPQASVSRLPIYLRALAALADARQQTVSSEMIAELTGVNAAKVRKDLSHLGSYGTRGAGYEVAVLIAHISQELGVNRDQAVVIVGAGNLGRALANYQGFSSGGFRIAALVDADPARVGEKIAGLEVRPVEELGSVAQSTGASIAVLATPASAAQEAADRAVAAGIGSILNFAPTLLSVPEGVSYRQVDLSRELQILSYYGRQAHGGDEPGASVVESLRPVGRAQRAARVGEPPPAEGDESAEQAS